MRINIEASAEELAEIAASGIAIGDLPEAIIVALDDCLSLPGYTVTVNGPSAIQAQLVEALEAIRAEYLDTINSAYCQVPVKQGLIDEVDAILVSVGPQP